MLMSASFYDGAQDIYFIRFLSIVALDTMFVYSSGSK